MVAIQIQLNGEAQAVESGSTVATLMEHLGLQTTPSAVELNQKLVPKTKWAQTAIAEGDRLEVVTLVGGG